MSSSKVTVFAIVKGIKHKYKPKREYNFSQDNKKPHFKRGFLKYGTVQHVSQQIGTDKSTYSSLPPYINHFLLCDDYISVFMLIFFSYYYRLKAQSFYSLFPTKNYALSANSNTLKCLFFVK
jgi:hypothetical protein